MVFDVERRILREEAYVHSQDSCLLNEVLE